MISSGQKDQLRSICTAEAYTNKVDSTANNYAEELRDFSTANQCKETSGTTIHTQKCTHCHVHPACVAPA